VNLYWLRSPSPLGAAYGYFYPDTKHPTRLRVCSDDCPVSSHKLIPPDPFELSYSGGREGDFAVAVVAMLARQSVALELEAMFSGLSVCPISLRKPGGRRGAVLEDRYRELRPALDLPPSPEKSSLEIVAECPRCGQRTYRLLGVQTEPSEVEVDGRWIGVPGKSRVSGKGIIASQADLHGADFFVFLGRLICRETVKDHIEGRGYTNVEFWEYGELVD
jgi:hypothetical protein